MVKTHEILETRRIADQEHIKALIRYGISHATANINVEEKLWDPCVIPPRKYCPQAPAGIKKALREIPEHCFVKLPRVRLWQPEEELDHLRYLKLRFLREAEVCERISRSGGHYNLATYHGCVVDEGGLLRGIVYSKYEMTLDEKVNPDHLYTKRDFRYGFSPLQDRAGFVQGVQNGLSHLHEACGGLVHNDLKPDNICIRAEDQSAVIIDFDSCTPKRAPLKYVGRTKGWFDPAVGFAMPSNDLEALDEIKQWLSDERAKDYQFTLDEW